MKFQTPNNKFQKKLQLSRQTPDAPNNIIHVRLATGSVVEQMNAHPFAKLHTALTHNGETTNYEALKQRVEQFRGWDKISSTFYLF